MKCANCDAQAAFEYRITPGKSLFYCGKDLPKFLEERKKAGHLKMTLTFNEDLASAKEKLNTAKVEETPEVVIPEAVVETPKPKKKTAKKSVE